MAGIKRIETTRPLCRGGAGLVQLHKSLEPYLTELKKQFARSPLLEALQLRSRYSIAFYQMCCSWYGSQTRSWSPEVDEIREWLHIEEGGARESKPFEIAKAI